MCVRPWNAKITIFKATDLSFSECRLPIYIDVMDSAHFWTGYRDKLDFPLFCIWSSSTSGPVKQASQTIELCKSGRLISNTFTFNIILSLISFFQLNWLENNSNYNNSGKSYKYTPLYVFHSIWSFQMLSESRRTSNRKLYGHSLHYILNLCPYFFQLEMRKNADVNWDYRNILLKVKWYLLLTLFFD